MGLGNKNPELFSNTKTVQKNEAPSHKAGPKVFHKGDYSEQFIVRALGFTECATPVSHHAFMAISTPLRQNRPTQFRLYLCRGEKVWKKLGTCHVIFSPGQNLVRPDKICQHI